jgi:signal transduction histidine kinase/DNA-binding NarL/FixJ family response regulator
MPDLRVLFIDSKQRLWVGQNGLYLFDAAKRTFSLYTDKAGLSTEFIKGITEDEKGNFWIATSNGLTRFHPETYAFKKYNTADGLQGLEFEANAYLKTKNGQLFFGGVNGFNAFYPKDIEANKFIPPVYITDFQIFNQKIVPGNSGSLLRYDISATTEIKLSYTQSTFSFGFAALNYTTSENNQYAYRLKGLDKEWNYVGNEHKATYNNLAPGTYFFEVKASNNDGIWNEEPKSIKIIITPPFWNTWWFITLLVLLIGSAAFVFIFFKRRYELQKLEERKRDEIHQVQLQFFTNISHEFRTPLSLILGPLEKLQKEDSNTTFRHYYHTMHRNATRLVGLINELMDFRKVESGALKLKVMPGNLDLFLHEIAEEFKSLAEEKDINFSVMLVNDFPQLWFDRQVLEKIVINLISNSFKYSAPGGTISIRAAKNLQQLTPSFANELILKNEYTAKDYVFIQIADNGIGISKESIKHLFERYYKITESHLGSGVGLAFVKSLTLLHKGDIYVFSERHKGTEIIIGLPVSKDDYSTDEKWFQNGNDSIVNIESMDYKYEHHLLSVNEDIQVSSVESFSKKKLILIVDDNEELRLFLRDSLDTQYQILEAADGHAGLLIAKENFPDLIISDVMMPGMNGIEFCKHIKEDQETSDIPFIMLTAKEALESKIEGVDSGADFYFSKPLSMNLLTLTIRNIFEQRQKLKDHYFKDHQIETKAKVHSIKDKEFVDQLLSIIEDQLNNPELDVEFICKKIGMSRTKLYQKIKYITGQSIGDFVRTFRLKKAMEIMTKEDVLLTEVMYRVGMQTQSYFTKAFKKEFGKTPTQFLQELKK